MARVVVVGAGVAGSACAAALQAARHDVVVLDKGRAPGGRCSTRIDGARTFDHGAASFTVRDPHFTAALAPLRERGGLLPWTPRTLTLDADGRPRPPRHTNPAPRFVGVPGMSAVVGHLQQGLDVRFGVTVDAIERTGSTLRVRAGADIVLDADAVVVAVPSPQAAVLVQTVAPALAARVNDAVMGPTWSLLLDVDGPVDWPADAAFVEDGALDFIGREASKPGRGAGSRFVVHAAAGFSAAHVDDDDAVARDLLLAAFARLRITDQSPAYAVAHRWRYARVERALGEAALVDGGVVVCGDFCIGPRVEAAFQSGLAAARFLAP